MPRKARIKSKSGVYHVMLRGTNQQQIFEDDEDNLKFLEVILDYKAVSEYEIYAYCLMGNHVHLLIKEGAEELQQIMKRIAGKYVYWYNTKYKRIGHLFQDRFKSEPVEDDKYLLTVMRYIHQNPIKAKITKHIDEYEYSSYKEYISDKYIIDTELVKNLLSHDDFIEFHQNLNSDKCIDIEDKAIRLSDGDIKILIKKYSKCENISGVQNLEKEKRKELLKYLKEQGGSIRQISRLTGISKAIVEKA